MFWGHIHLSRCCCGRDAFDAALVWFHWLPGRAKTKMEEQEKLLETAVKNYTQLGGVVQADQKKQQENSNTRR